MSKKTRYGHNFQIIAFCRTHRNSGDQSRVQNFFYNLFKLFFWNAECVRIFWVYAPKNFPIENFRVRSNLQKISLFHEFSCRFGKKNRRPAADSILMPPTFHIARLNRYTPNFSGVPQKLTWCQQFGLQIFPTWGDADFFTRKCLFLVVFLD